jgi:RHS repeat-associated protein
VTITVLPANQAPIVNAGPNQTITLPNTAQLNGTVADDGFPAGASVNTFWGQVSGPGPVTFNDINNPVTRVMFPTAGTYVLRLSASDTHRVGSDDIQITVNASPALVGATLQLAAVAPGPYVTGTPQTVRATLRNSAGNPLANFGVEFTVSGPNATAGSGVTNTSGIATFTYAGTNPGTDTVTALVRSTATANVNGTPPIAMVWTLTPQSPPVTQGWIGGPLNGASVTGSVPITVGAGMTLTNVKVEYWPASNPAGVTTLVEGAQGGPGATLATLDTTLVANGNYVVRVTATDANGNQQVSQVTITVTGENKPGRITVSFTDLTVPVAGIPITIQRNYDSLERNQIGDFGYGWSLDLAGPRLEVAPDNDVTITDPVSGRRVTFQFTPTSFGFPFGFLFQPTYTPEPGVFGKLQSDGCGLLIRSNGGVICFLSLDINYRPTTYAYTDPYGRVYTVTADGKLRSIKNVDGNSLTFGPNGITSSAGNLTVPFVRDAQGRIEQITDPTGKVYRYTYDSLGDLTSVQLADIGVPMTHEYDAGHYFRKGTDARGNVQAVTTYYADGRLKSVTDAMGKTTGYAYDLANNATTITHPDNTGSTVQRHDSNGLLLSETDPLGRTKSYTYDAARNKRTETDALNKTTTWEYDTNGNIRTVIDPSGKKVTYVSDSHGQPISTTNELGHVRTLQYDAQANLTSVTDPRGVEVAMTWNDKGTPTSITDGSGQTTRFTYDAFGNVVSKTDPQGRTTSYTYDGIGRPVTMTDARGLTRFAYDSLGRLTSLVDTLDNETRYEYDANGNRIKEIDARQHVTLNQYDAANRLTKTTRPDGSTVEYTYNFRGQKLTETTKGPSAGLAPAQADDFFEMTSIFDYDNAGQLVKVTFPDGNFVSFTYDAAGRLKAGANENGKTWSYEYDESCGCNDRLTKITNPAGGVITYEYDAAGRLIAFTDPNNRTTRYEYDVRDFHVKTTFPDNSTIVNTHDGMGRVLTTTDQEGRVTRFTYDSMGNVLTVTDAKNGVTQYTYDSQNNLLSSTNANGATTRYEYDALNRLIRKTLPLGMTELFTYDQVGNQTTRTDSRGKQTSFEYDEMGRVLARRPDPTLNEANIFFTYSPTGRRRSMIDGSGTTNYTYDVRDRLQSKQSPQGTLTYTYDPTGNLLTMRSSNADGVSVDYTYDELNRTKTVVDNRLGGATTTYTYDNVGNLKSDQRPNGVRTDYNYNLTNRLSDMATAKSGTTQASYVYTSDRTGRRLSVTELGGRTVSYSYDQLYRLTREAATAGPTPASNGAVDYTYDAVGNRLSRISSIPALLSKTSSYDANDRVTSDAYDVNGNARTTNGRSYTYDSEDRVKTANNGAVRITYDGDSNMVAKTVNGVTTKYLVDEVNPTEYCQIVEELVGGQVVKQYTFGNMIVSQRQLLNGNWSASFYSFDGHSSVRQLTDESGVVTDTYTYDAFGNIIERTGTTPNAILYSQEYFDSDLGLYNLRARHYDPNQGRFTSIDPFGGFVDEPLSIHKYLYVHADPVNLIDPEGLAALSEYGTLQRIWIRTVAALRALGRAICCIFIYAASWIASMVGYWAWNIVRQVARRMRLQFCLCKIGKTTRGYTLDKTREYHREKGKDWEEAVDLILTVMGYDTDRGPGNEGVPHDTPRGERRTDVETVKNGRRSGVEAKVNYSRGRKQRWKDNWLWRHGPYDDKVREWRWNQWRCFKR